MDGAILKAYIKDRKLNRTKLAADLGMSKQNLYQLFKTRAFEADTINTIERKFRLKWEKIKETVNIDVPRATTKPQTAQKGQIATNGAKEDYLSGKNLENFSEAHRVLASIVHAQSGSRQDQVLAPILGVIQEVFQGKKQVTIDELLKELRKAGVLNSSYKQ